MKRSETIGALAKALVGFNSEVAKISKDAANPFLKNKYATLDNIIEAIRPILQKNGLSIMQFPSSEGEYVSLSTYILHESGEWLESDLLHMRPVKNDPQAIGSCITYARRYSLQAFLNLNTGEDDDGNEAASQKPKQQRPPRQEKTTEQYQQQADQYQDQQPPQQEQQRPKGFISDKQLKLLNTLITRMDTEKKIGRERTIHTLRQKPEIGHFESTKDLTTGQASKAIEVLQNALGDNNK